MRKVLLHASVKTAVAALLTAGAHLTPAPAAAQTSYQYRQMTQELTAVRQENARRMADMQVLQENQRKLLAMLEEYREDSEARAQETARLRQRTAALEARLEAVDSNWRSEITKLQRGLSQEGETRQKSIRELIKAVSKDFAEAVNKVGIPTGGGEQTHTVQAGDTLSAISQAFKIPVESLKKANGLTSDVIRPGQVLKIPEK